MSNVFGIYYYAPSQNTANVKLLGICSSYNKCLEMIRVNFHEYHTNVTNSISCRNRTNTQCILWVNKYETDKQFESNGVTCNQPNCSVEIFDLLVNKN